MKINSIINKMKSKSLKLLFLIFFNYFIKLKVLNKIKNSWIGTHLKVFLLLFLFLYYENLVLINNITNTPMQ